VDNTGFFYPFLEKDSSVINKESCKSKLASKIFFLHHHE